MTPQFYQGMMIGGFLFPTLLFSFAWLVVKIGPKHMSYGPILSMYIVWGWVIITAIFMAVCLVKGFVL